MMTDVSKAGAGAASTSDPSSPARASPSPKAAANSNAVLKVFIVVLVVLYVMTLALVPFVLPYVASPAHAPKTEEHGALLTPTGDYVVQVRQKVDVVTPFDLVDKPLTEIELFDAVYLDNLPANDGGLLERMYKVEMVTRNTESNAIQLSFLGGDYMIVDADSAFLFIQAAKAGCTAEDTLPDGYCAVVEVTQRPPEGADLGEDSVNTDVSGRFLQARSSIVGAQYNLGPRGSGRNINFNTKRLYGNSGFGDTGGIVNLGRSRFFSHGQFRACRGPSCFF
ncbi:unnamed protein product [Vitrella brassicaformis CCMP3155]|uniref:Uncharacterized protein n=1 Tax=Vitrella brassicaformis (strain CCMP3155) TaxID=1169540 RepID=A0A0G4GUX1_VITBC|nr:unnamed protein product [Vitrella brassicaformis CCMP3155]|eukprot:CEM34421.1 unnamed protein product [Vitrella brassicaformis CCMP3155]